VAYHAFADADEPNVVPVYRFFSENLNSHVYTISESEKNKLLNNYPDAWTYQTIAFYVYPEGHQPGAGVTDTVVFVDNEIVKRYDGDIANRNCARCNHPELYPEFAHHEDDGGSPTCGANRQ